MQNAPREHSAILLPVQLCFVFFEWPLKTGLTVQGSHRFEKTLNLEGFLEKFLKIKYALKSTGKSCKGLEKSLNSSILCRN